MPTRLITSVVFNGNTRSHHFKTLDRHLIGVGTERGCFQLGRKCVGHLPADHSVAVFITQANEDVLLFNLVDLNSADPTV